MRLKAQKRLAACVAKCSEKAVIFDPDRLEDIKESITKADIRGLIIDKAIVIKKTIGQSRGRARKIAEQKRKGRQKGPGSRKGKATARLPSKRAWITKIRTQKSLLKALKDKEYLTKKIYRELYLKAKGGFFRSRRHIKLYIEEHKLASKRT